MNSTKTGKVGRKQERKAMKVDFDGKLTQAQRMKLKYFSGFFLKKVVLVIFRLVLLIGISYIVLFPFISKIAGSFMSPEDFVDVTVKLIPKYPTLTTYKAIIVENNYLKAFLNTFTLSLLCAVVQTAICTLVAYGFAKFKFKGNKILFFAVIFTMVVPHQTLMLSMFMKFRYFDVFGIIGLLNKMGIVSQSSLNLINTYVPLGILSLGGIAFKNGLYIFMLRQFFKGVPDELEEAAYVDGSGTFRTFVKIIIPLSVPMMITVFLFSFSWQWTDSFYTNMFFTTDGTYLLPNIVSVPKSLSSSSFVAQDLYNSAIKNTSVLLIIAPLIILYCFCQKYLVQGIERSGIVG